MEEDEPHDFETAKDGNRVEVKVKRDPNGWFVSSYIPGYTDLSHVGHLSRNGDGYTLDRGMHLGETHGEDWRKLIEHAL